MASAEVSRGSRNSSGPWVRDTLIHLLFERWGAHFGLPDVQLLVEMGEFSAGIFKEELAIENERSGKEIEEQCGEVNQNCGPILMEQNCLIWNEELQFAEEPKAERQENGDCQEE
jgi:hypothetical protein